MLYPMFSISLTNTVISMNQAFIGFYLTIFILAGMIAYAGIENTLNLFRYIDISIRYQIILLRTAIMRYRLKRALDKSLQQFKND